MSACSRDGSIGLKEFENDQAQFYKCQLCGNWWGIAKEGQHPDEYDMVLAIYLHLGLIEKAGIQDGEQAYRMTEKGRRFKPGMTGSSHF